MCNASKPNFTKDVDEMKFSFSKHSPNQMQINNIAFFLNPTEKSGIKWLYVMSIETQITKSEENDRYFIITKI